MSEPDSRKEQKSPDPPLPPTHVLELCLYVRSMPAAVSFYRDILQLTPKVSSPRLTMFPLGITSLILFQLGTTEADSDNTSTATQNESHIIPGHGPDRNITNILNDVSAKNATDVDNPERLGVKSQSLRTHFCLAVAERDEVFRWEEYLRAKGVKIRGIMEWARGGRSVYFEDVDGHVGEIGSRGIWEHY